MNTPTSSRAPTRTRAARFLLAHPKRGEAGDEGRKGVQAGEEEGQDVRGTRRQDDGREGARGGKEDQDEGHTVRQLQAAPAGVLPLQPELGGQGAASRSMGR